MSESAMQQAHKTAVSKSTQTDTSWCFSLWTESAKQRNRRTDKEQVPLNILAVSPLALEWMSRFMLKSDGNEYTPDTLYHIVYGVMRYLHQNGRLELDLLKKGQLWTLKWSDLSEPASETPRNKQNHSLRKNYYELKSLEINHSAQALLSTVFFFKGVCFALRGEGEHRELHFKNSQIQLVDKPGRKLYFEKQPRCIESLQNSTKTCYSPSEHGNPSYNSISYTSASTQLPGGKMPSTSNHSKSQQTTPGSQTNH